MKKTLLDARPGDPFERASLWSRITFAWVNPVINTVRHRSYSMEDHDELSKRFDVSRTIGDFEKDFEKYRSLGRLFLTHIDGKCRLTFINIVFTFCEVANVYLLYDLTEYLKEIKDGLQILDKQRLATYFGLMILSNILMNLMETIYDFLLYREFMKIKNNYTLLVIKQILKINMHSNSETSRGNLVNLIQIDCAAVEDVGYELVMSTYILFQFMICFAIGFTFFGADFGVYIGVSLIFMLIAIGLENICMRIDKCFMNIRDDRLSFVSNVLSNIRFVKFNVLENYFAKIASNYRRKEVRLLWWYNLVYACAVFIDWIASAVAKIAFFVFYFWRHSKMALQQYMAFMNLDFMLSGSFSQLPWVFAALFRIRLSFKRLNKFFDIPPFYSNIIHENLPPFDNVSTNLASEIRETKNTTDPQQSEKRDLLSQQNSDGLLNDEDSRFTDRFFVREDQAPMPSVQMNNVNFSYVNPEVEEFEDFMDEDEDSSSEEEVEAEEDYDNELDETDRREGMDNDERGQPLDTEANEPTFKLSKTHLALRDIKLTINKGELVFIIGGIGSGKSSFLYSLIGELNQIFADNIVNRFSVGKEFIKIRGLLRPKNLLF